MFTHASSTYNLVAPGVGLFNESILTERGFAAGTYHRSLVIVALLSLVGNFLGGWLAVRWSMNRLMALTMALLGMALCALPSLKTLAQVHAFSVVMGLRPRAKINSDFGLGEAYSSNAGGRCVCGG